MFIAALNEVRSTNIIRLSRKAAETVDRVQIRLYDIVVLAIVTFLIVTNYIQYIERIQLRNDIPLSNTNTPATQNISFANFDSPYKPSYPIIVVNEESGKLLGKENDDETQDSNSVDIRSVQESPSMVAGVQKIGSLSLSSIQRVQIAPLDGSDRLPAVQSETSTKVVESHVFADDNVKAVLKDVAILIACQAVVGAVFPMIPILSKSIPILRYVRRFSSVATKLSKVFDKAWHNLVKFYSVTSGSKIVTRGKKIIKMFMHFGDHNDHHHHHDDNDDTQHHH
jgi:hypothetical protein